MDTAGCCVGMIRENEARHDKGEKGDQTPMHHYTSSTDAWYYWLVMGHNPPQIVTQTNNTR